MSNTGSPYSSEPWRRDDENPGQPTGWERPSSDPASQSSGPDQPASQFSSQPSSEPSSQPSASDWPSYPPSSQPSAPEPTRPLETGGQPGYQAYDQQSMPNYGGGPNPGYGSNPYDSNPYDQAPVNPYQQPYGAYQAYAVPPQHPQATTAFVLGLLGLIICPPVGIGGLVMGGRVRREIDASGGQLGGKGLATAGWVLGILSVIYLALIVAYLIFIVVLIATGSMNS